MILLGIMLALIIFCCWLKDYGYAVQLMLIFQLFSEWMNKLMNYSINESYRPRAWKAEPIQM